MRHKPQPNVFLATFEPVGLEWTVATRLPRDLMTKTFTQTLDNEVKKTFQITKIENECKLTFIQIEAAAKDATADEKVPASH